MSIAAPRVFVSHSHGDSAWCHSYVEALRQGGADVWYDEHNLNYGELMDEIEREIAARPVFSVVLSPKACASHWVRREMTAAIELLDHQPGHILLPVIAVPCDIPLLWRAYKRISGPGDLPLPPNEAAARVLQALRAGGAGTVSEAPPEAATPHEQVERAMADGAALATAGQLVEALRAYDSALSMDPQQVPAWAGKADALYNLGRFEQALMTLDRARALDPHSGELVRSRGFVLLALHRSTEALSTFQTAHQLGGDEAKVWNGQAAALYQLGRLREARRASKRALDLAPDQMDAWNTLGVICNAMKKYQAALAAFDRALQLDPQNAKTWTNKAGVLFCLQRYGEALTLCDHALGLNPKEAAAWDNKIATLKAAGRQAEAAEVAQRRAAIP